MVKWSLCTNSKRKNVLGTIYCTVVRINLSCFINNEVYILLNYTSMLQNYYI